MVLAMASMRCASDPADALADLQQNATVCKAQGLCYYGMLLDMLELNNARLESGENPEWQKQCYTRVFR